MSIDLMRLAFRTPYPATPKLILLTLCDNADDTGACFPSHTTISKKSSCAKSTQSYNIRAFERIGLLTKELRKRQNGSDASTIYNIDIDFLEKNAIVLIKTKTETEKKELKKKCDLIKNEFKKAYQNIRKDLDNSPSDTYSTVHNVTPTPVHDVIPLESSPRDTLYPSSSNPQYMNDEEEEEYGISKELIKKFPLAKFFINFESSKSKVKYKGSYVQTLIKNFEKGHLKTLANYQVFISSKNIKDLQKKYYLKKLFKREIIQDDCKAFYFYRENKKYAKFSDKEIVDSLLSGTL
ncbi:MAG: hypothetical protein GQ570_13460 [Helicobacteraceae bacterium]|nr:hypothetical protein [Helicobacteraceae bacterium]